MLARIAHDIGHPRLSPARVDLLVAGLAGGRADVMGIGALAASAAALSRRRPSAASGAGTPRSAKFPDRGDPRPASPCCVCRHGRGEDLTVRQRGKRLAKGRRARIDVRADRRPTTAVEAMADRAFLLKRGRAGGDSASSGFRGLARSAASAGTLCKSSQVATSISIDGRCRTGAGKSGQREPIESRCRRRPRGAQR